jgi:hypothetical protein
MVASVLPKAQHPAPLASLDDAGDARRALESALCITASQPASVRVNEGVLAAPSTRHDDRWPSLAQPPLLGMSANIEVGRYAAQRVT